jgi:hypothetical protein
MRGAVAFVATIVDAGLLLRGVFVPAAGFLAFAAAPIAWRVGARRARRR